MPAFLLFLSVTNAHCAVVFSFGGKKQTNINKTAMKRMMRQCSAVSFHRFLTFCSSPAKVLSHLRLRLTTRSLEISGTRVTNDYLRRRVNRKSKKKGEIKNKKACDPCECGKMRFTAERIESSFCKRVSVIFKSLTVNIHFLIRNVYGAL